GEELVGTYDEDGYVEGINEVTVTTELLREYSTSEDIVWGYPDNVINETVNIKDISELFGKVNLGTVTAPSNHTFMYDGCFKWEDYGGSLCGDYQYDNTATIIETQQSSSASLKVNVQCYIDETAYAMGESAKCFLNYQFSQWGWTNPIVPSENEYVWPLYTGAAFCDPDKGENVGTVKFEYEDGDIKNVKFNLDWPYEIEEYHIYAGKDMFPQQTRGKKTIDTVAPGQYYIEDDLSGEIYVIVHAVVKMPDPNFGPNQ
ncbi:MAG TPA: hypothetical protein VKN64_07205, partial [Halanaerobiales bacterium]|nr:hypothetical protein [Halanaerobiales bacterium]